MANVDKMELTGAQVEPAACPFNASAIHDSVKWIDLLKPTNETDEVTRLRFLGVPDAEEKKIKIASYNVLATSYHLRKDDDPKFDFAKKYTRDDDLRMYFVMEKIVAIDADIVLLQEVEGEGPLLGLVADRGYVTYYVPRPTAPVNSILEKGGSSWANKAKDEEREVGIAILVKKQRLIAGWNMVRQLAVDLNAIQAPHTKSDSSPAKTGSTFSYKDLNNVAQLMYLDIGKGRLLAIANIHAHWNDKLADIKKQQMIKTNQELVRIGSALASLQDTGIAKFSATPSAYQNNTPTRVYYFFGGDFNCPREEVMLDLGSSYERYDMRENGVQFAEIRGKVSSGGNPATHLSPDYSNTIDHIFYRQNFAETRWSGVMEPCTCALRVLRIPRSDEGLAGEKYLPRYNEPSDHFPVGAEFVLY